MIRIRLQLAAIAALPALVPIAAAVGQQTTSLERRVQQVMDRPEFRHAFFGIEFYSLDDARPVWSLNGDKLFTSASTTKLLTEGTALELLGADYRFHTRVYRTGPIDANGTLNGDLVLVASGDPNLSQRIQPGDVLAFENEDHAYDASPDTKAVPGDPLTVIRSLAGQVASRGVKRIAGRVLVDVSLFHEGDRELGTGVVISPVVVNDNLVDVILTPGDHPGAPTTMHVSPETPYARFVNESTTGTPGSRPSVNWKSDERAADGSHTITIGGATPGDKGPILYSYAVPEPSRYAEVALVQSLRERGVAVELPSPQAERDSAHVPPAYIAGNVVAEHVSPPFREDVKVTLKVSQNLHASSTPFIVKAILAPNDTGRTGFDLEHDFLQRAGLDLSGAQQSDGAGGDAHFSPDFMVHWLAYMARQKDAQAFHDALPILGKDGTLFNVQTASPAAGHVHAKTGTLGAYDALNRGLLLSAKGLAGYFTTPAGRRYAFAAYVNNVAVSLAPDEATRIAGQALGEIAAAGYLTLP